jgi:type 1 fimbriae regulatory protein FimB
MPREPRLRDYLTRDEVAALLRAAKKSPRHGARNHAMILLACRHGLRATELVNLRVSDLDLANGTIYCRRAKNSRSSLHPMKADEVTTLEKMVACGHLPTSDYVFQSERSEKIMWTSCGVSG